MSHCFRYTFVMLGKCIAKSCIHDSRSLESLMSMSELSLMLCLLLKQRSRSWLHVRATGAADPCSTSLGTSTCAQTSLLSWDRQRSSADCWGRAMPDCDVAYQADKKTHAHVSVGAGLANRVSAMLLLDH